MSELITAIVMAAVAIVGALGSYITAWLVKKKNDLELKSLREAIDDGEGTYYILCPFCGKKILLKNAVIHKEEEHGSD